MGNYREKENVKDLFKTCILVPVLLLVALGKVCLTMSLVLPVGNEVKLRLLTNWHAPLVNLIGKFGPSQVKEKQKLPVAILGRKFLRK